MRSVGRISIAPVQGSALLHPDYVELTEHGVLENRRFFLADDAGNRVRSSLAAWTCLVRAVYHARSEVLQLSFPGGRVEGTAIAEGERLTYDMGGRAVPGQVVRGPWEEPLAALAGHPVRVVRSDVPGARQNATVTLLSDGSLARLSREAGSPVDDRRFRMLFVLAGCEAHDEDTWEGRRVAIGAAVVRAGAPVVRCAVTTRDPQTGLRDLDTLRLIASYRHTRNGDVLFGVYGEVEQPGVVAVGDTVEPL